jgi:CelD/BcsL family acetyltransferase involved in cellulose biosynthesis
MMTPTIDVISDRPGLERLRSDWDDLLDHSATRGPFLSWDWLQPWWSHLSGAANLNVIAVRRDGLLIALAPLMRSRTFPFSSRLEFMGTGNAGSDYLDLIIRRGDESQAMSALAGEIASEQLPLYLDHLPPTSMADRLAQGLAAENWTPLEVATAVCPLVMLAGHTWDSYLATLGSNHRANVRRRERSLVKAFDVRFERVTTEPERHAALEALIAFHAHRFTTERGSTAFHTPALRQFHHDATQKALAANRLRLFTLRLDGEIAAVMYGFARGKTFYFYQHGFSETHAKASVGLVLMGMTIRAAIEEGFDEFDMLYGDEPYKSLWTRERLTLGRLQLFPPHAAGMLLRRQAETRQALRAVAHQLGLKRHHAAP